jgi:hypothetical protein
MIQHQGAINRDSRRREQLFVCLGQPPSCHGLVVLDAIQHFLGDPDTLI